MGKHSADTTLPSGLPTVAELLEILPDGWTVIPGLHDLVPELAEADQVVVGPGGVFVVVAPEWVGPFRVEDGVVVANGVTRERETEACLDTAVAVATVAGTYAEWIVPVLCVTTEELLLEWAMEARICSLASLLDALTEAPVVLPPSHVKHATHVLQTAGAPQPEPVATPLWRPEPEAALPEPAPDAEQPAPQPAPASTDTTAEAAEAAEVAEVAEVAEPTSARSRRVAAAMAAAEETAAQVAADQASRGITPGKAKKKSGESASRIKSLVALVVAAAVVGGLGLNYDRIIPAVHGVYDQLSGAPTCVPVASASDPQTLTPTGPIQVPKTDKHGKPLSKAARAKARKRAEARAKRLAVKQVSAPALEAATC
jgi:hypothetical protein